MTLNEFIDQIIAMTPAEFVQYIDKRPRLGSDDDRQSTWKGIAQYFETQARTLAYAGGQTEQALELATISINLFRRLAKEAHSDYWRKAHLSSEMSVRCGMISYIEPITGHPILDPEILQDLFLSTTGFELKSVSQAREQLATRRATDIESDARLNGRMTLIRPLIAEGIFPRNDELRAWEEAIFGQPDSATSRSKPSSAKPIVSASHLAEFNRGSAPAICPHCAGELRAWEPALTQQTCPSCGLEIRLRASAG